MYSINNDAIRLLTAALEVLDNFVFFETGRFSPENQRSFLLFDPICWLSCRYGDDPLDFLDQAESYRRQGYFLAGWIGYEFGYLLEPGKNRPLGPDRKGQEIACLGVFNNPIIYNHFNGKFSGGSRWPERKVMDSGCRIENLQTNISEEEFYRCIEEIKGYIAAGDTYQVNYTFKLDFTCSGSTAALYRQLRRNQSVAYSAWIRRQHADILSFSPELFFAADRSGIRVRPMKGTLGRGRTVQEDLEWASALRQDPKSQSENVMIVDLLRNDLGRLLQTSGGGRVQVRSLFDVEPYESLLQMTSTIDGIPEPARSLPLRTMFQSLFPCGSVTGAPKIRTMEIINELEKEPRGVYCGAIGYCHGDEMCFNVPIRTLTLEDGHGRMGIGAGIVHDSDPKEEWRECLLKGRFLTHSRPDFQLIETLAWFPDTGYSLLRFHLERLADSAQYFFFICDLAAIEQRLLAEAEGFSFSMRVRVLLTKDGTLQVTATALAAAVTPGKGLPVVAFANERIGSEDIFLYHKTTNRRLFNRLRKQAEQQDLYELLLCNTREEVTEGTISTLFVELDGQLYTPPVSCGLLAGVYRRFMLENNKARERVLYRDDVIGAEKVYLANSVRGLIQVALVDNKDM